ncbi:hypothetical protein ABFY58_28820 [Enterobacter soli]
MTRKKGRYADSANMDDVKQYTTQWLNTVEVGHGNIGAGLDWQKQKTRRARAIWIKATSSAILVCSCLQCSSSIA